MRALPQPAACWSVLASPSAPSELRGHRQEQRHQAEAGTHDPHGPGSPEPASEGGVLEEKVDAIREVFSEGGLRDFAWFGRHRETSVTGEGRGGGFCKRAAGSVELGWEEGRGASEVLGGARGGGGSHAHAGRGRGGHRDSRLGRRTEEGSKNSVTQLQKVLR